MSAGRPSHTGREMILLRSARCAYLTATLVTSEQSAGERGRPQPEPDELTVANREFVLLRLDPRIRQERDFGFGGVGHQLGRARIRPVPGDAAPIRLSPAFALKRGD